MPWKCWVVIGNKEVEEFIKTVEKRQETEYLQQDQFHREWRVTVYTSRVKVEECG